MLDSFDKVIAICFSKNGENLCKKLNEIVPGFSYSRGFGEDKIDREKWTSEAFFINSKKKILVIFVCALGIAVRSISPFLKCKTSDPAVLCIDDKGTFVIPVLSGHIGGANEAAKEIAHALKALPVITTATDIHGAFQVDSWAVAHNMAIKNPSAIKKVSAAVLEGKKIRIGADKIVLDETSFFKSLKDAAGENATENDFEETSAGVFLTVSESYKYADKKNTLFCLPKILCIGVGCRRGTSEKKIRDAIDFALKKAELSLLAVKTIASIDVKKEEEGLLQYASNSAIPFSVFCADELNSLLGNFSSSEFVFRTVGTDCVCERAAVAASENKKLLLKKTILADVTVAIAI